MNRPTENEQEVGDNCFTQKRPKYGTVQLKVKFWPIQDQRAWEKALVQPDQIGAKSSFSRLANKTILEREKSYGKFLNFLSKSGRLIECESPRDRVIEANVIGYIANLRLRQSAISVNEELNRLRSVMKVFAPAEYWCWIKRLPNAPRGPEIRASKRNRSAAASSNSLAEQEPAENVQSKKVIETPPFSLPLSSWPSTDRVVWERAKRSNNLFDENARLAKLAPASVFSLESSYGTFLGHLKAESLLDPTVTAAAQANSTTFMQFIERLRLRRRESSIRGELANLTTVLNILRPDSDWRWICRLPNAPNRAEGDASRKTIIPPDPALVLKRSLRQFDRATEAAPSSRNDVCARNGLLVAFCTLFALRLKNLCDLEIGKHLNVGRDRMQVTVFDSMKNGSAVIFDVPLWLVPRLQLYLTVVRPRILNNLPDHGSLWISSRNGSKLSRSEINRLFSRFGKREFGRSFNTHVMRHAMANELVIRDPGASDLIAAALGHTTSQMVNEVYTRSASVSLSRLWQKTLISRRRERGLD